MKKKIMAVLVAAGMVISLAACGGSSAQSQTAESTAEAVESTAEAVESTAEAAESTAEAGGV